MCNLLLPLCPFVLHSVDTSTQSGQQYGRSPSDAQILYSYLSNRPYDNRTSRSREYHWRTQTIPLAQKTTKLYRRTNWHTCACFFRRVGVLHPMPGPSRPTFGMAYKPCKRCSRAAKTLKPVRRGGISDNGDPYWDRCNFACARGVLEHVVGDDDRIGRYLRFSSQDEDVARGVARPVDSVEPDDSGGHQTHHQCALPRGHMYPNGQDPERDSFHQNQKDHPEQRAKRGKDEYKPHYVPRTSESANISYGEGLDRYLADTYASKLSMKA